MGRPILEGFKPVFNDPPRRKHVRFRDRDYSQPAVYFVTICSADHHEIFGTIEGTAVCLSAIGGIIDQEWMRLPESFPTVRLDEHIVMPNHLHGIIIIGPSTVKPATLGTVIRRFKSGVTTRIKRELNDPEAAPWHRSYHEHVVGGSDDLERVRRYIRANPANWSADDYGPGRNR
jgi:putative transposase